MSLEEETVEEVVEKRKRTSRKRATANSVDSPAAETPAVRKRVPRKRTPAAIAAATTHTETEPMLKRSARKSADNFTEPVRKAPTPIAAERAATKSSRRQAIVVAVLMIIGVGASAAIGFTDKGSINVEETIAQRNARINSGEIQGEILEVQNTPQLPDGGLIGLGIGGPEANASSTQSTTASSTEATASSTPTGGIPLTAEEAAALQAQASSTGQ